MSQPNQGPGEKDSRPDQPTQPNQPETPAKPKKKKRRLLLKTFIGVVVLILLLVLLAPTILSTGMVRDFVVGQINSSALNGKLQIKDWSFGWTSGVHIDDVELNDANDVHLLSVAEISTPISFLKAATGNIDLGDVVVKGVDFNAIMDSKGQVNILEAIKPSNKPPSNEPTKLPNIKGTLHLQNVTGTFQDDRDKLAIGLPQQAPLNVTATISDINQPIQDSVDLGLQLDEKNLVQVKVSGTVSAIQNNLVDVPHLAADQTIELSQGDLAAVNHLLHTMNLSLDVAGKMDGKIVAKISGLDNVSANVGINVAGLSAGGKQLAGDTVGFESIAVGVNASVNGPAIKVDLPITLQSKGGAKPDHVNIHVDVPRDSIAGAGDVFKAILARLTKSGAATAATIPGAGNIKISADLDVANLVTQMPHFLHLEQGTTLSSGTLSHVTTITLANGQAVIATKTDLTDFAGSNAGTPIHLQDIDASAGVTAVGGDHPDFHNIQLGLSSPFANVQGGGETIGKLKIQGSSDLQNLQKQLGQIVDFDSLFHAPAGSHVSLVGTIGFDAHTDGDFTANDQMIAVGADLNATGVKIDIPGRRSIDEPKLTASISTNLHHTAAEFVEAARDLAIAVQSPAINFAANANVVMGGKFGASVPSFAISQGTIDLRLVQEEFGGALSIFVPPAADGQTPTLVQRIADNSVRIASGSVTISGKGKFDQGQFGFDEPLAITMQPTDLTIADDMGTVQTVHVPAVAIALSGNGSAADQGGASFKNLSLTTTVGTSQTPLLALAVSADGAVQLPPQNDPGAVNVSASRIELSRLDGDLPGLQAAFAPLIPLLVPQPAVAATQPSIVQLLAQNLLVCTSGKLSGSMLASYDGTLKFQKPLAISIADLTLQQHGAAVTTPINKQTVQAVVGGSISLPKQGGLSAQLTDVLIQVGDELKIQGDPRAPIAVAMNPTLSASGTVQLVNANLPSLLNTAGIVLSPDQLNSLRQLTSGAITGNIRLQNGTNATNVTAEINLDSLTVGNVLNNEKAHVLASADLANDFSAIHDVTVAVDTSFAKKLSITDGQVVLMTQQGGQMVPVGLFDKLQSVKVEADDVDLAKISAVANVLFAQAAAPVPGEKVVAQVPPPQLTAGTATFMADISRSGNTTTANITQALVHGLTIKTGATQYAWPNDLNAHLTAALQTNGDQLSQATVNTLSFDSGIGTTVGLSDNKPIVITNLGDAANMSAQGGVAIAGDIAQLARVAEAMGGAKANTYPYQGQINLNEALSKLASQPRLHLDGGGTVTNFVVMGPAGPNGAAPQQLFAENKITLSNPLDFDFKTFSLIIDPSNPVAVALQSTGALAVSVTGTVNDVLVKRQIADDNKVVVKLSYDLAKLWPIIKPMLSASTQQTLADLQISGAQQRTFTVSGSYPGDQPFNQAIAALNANGYFTVDSLSTQGITLQNMDVAINLSGGVVRTTYADGKLPPPATCNGGTLDIGGAELDLRTMLLSMPRGTSDSPQFILKGVTLNPALAKNVVGKLLNNPAFSGANQANGLLTVNLFNTKDLPITNLGDSSPANKGTAVAVYSITGLQVGSPLLAAFGNASVSADINNANVKYAAGRVSEDMTMMIDQNKPLRIAGVVVIATEQFAPMTAYIPTALLSKFIPANVQQYVPDQVVVALQGDMNKPQLKLDQTIAQLVKDAGKKAILNGILQGLQRH